ncbi:FadR/GntR family transcriptional regulator [Planctomonas psychrotolerans]|uniref:FadR/GntR family transcriptional regulator n=1 Tax=Planctomonas psychrotolerans TaxID=2528712 RepID=UPI00123862B8|nr:FadR/GntR family transcriptional regulator [Planctomonas psychrotolerans]
MVVEEPREAAATTGSDSSAWQPVQRLRAHEQVMSQIESRILAGHLKAGDHLPSERDLATMLGVSRPSLRESLRVLESLGIVEIRRGGVDGGAVLLDGPGAGLVNLLRLQVALGHFTQRDLLDTRLALETWSCAEAAQHAEPADLAELSGMLDAMDDPGIEAGDFNRLDAGFHERIAQASGNALTAHLMGSLRLSIHRQMVEAYSRLPDWRATTGTVRHEHRLILEAIRNGDAPRASTLVQDHIRSFYTTGALVDE